MKKHQLQSLLNAEVDEWAGKSYSKLVEDLADIAAYERSNDDGFYQFEVQMIEHEPDYVHVIVSIDDGSFLRSLKPLSWSFIVHRDGRVEK